MQQPGRKYQAVNGYRYGFNGKENDNEMKGEGNQQDYGMRIYDLRLGRFLSVDPLTASYPYYTPYQFAGNAPIRFVDLDGAERATPEEVSRSKKYLTETISSYIIKNQTYTRFKTISGNCLVEQLGATLSNPGEGLKKQADEVGNMCGVYAFSYLFAIYNPTEFVKGVASLYVTGEMETNRMTTSSILGIEGKKDDLSNQSLPVFIFGGSIRDRSNQFLGYKGLVARYWGSTNTSTMKSWITDFLGANVTEQKMDMSSSKGRNKTMRALAGHVNEGKDLVLRVSASIYKSLSKGEKLHTGQGLEAGLSGGDHWIVVTGMKFDEKNKTLQMTSFDMNQGQKTFTLSVADFQSMTYDALKVERKE